MDMIMEVKDLNLWYGDHHARRDLRVDIPKNQITALLAPPAGARPLF